MSNLATPKEMVADILTDSVLQSRICADAFIGLLMMADMQEKEKAACCEQAEHTKM